MENSLRTWWKPIENLRRHIGNEEKWEKPPLLTPIQKEKNRGTLSTCRASHWLHAISLHKTVCYHFWPRLMEGKNFGDIVSDIDFNSDMSSQLKIVECTQLCSNLWKTDWAASVPSFWFLPFFFLDTNGKNPLHRKVPSYVWGHQILELYSHLLHLIPTKYWRLTQFDRHDLNFRHPSPHVMEYDLQGTSSITDGQCWFWNS
jgi:hypothetical protein